MRVLLLSLIITLCGLSTVVAANLAKKFDVVIVGAGMSGIAAGKKLKEHGFSVVILEARNYIGGRIRTVNVSNTPIDLGAGFIEGTINNPIFDLANKYNIPNSELDWNNGIIFNTFAPPFGEISNQQYERVDQLTTDLNNKIDQLQNEDLSNMTSIAQGLKTWISTHSLTNQIFLSFIMTAEVENDYAADVNDLSLNYFNQDNGNQGGYRIMTRGFTPLINALMQDSKLDVRLEHVVSAITYSDTGGTVTTNKGDFYGKWVICTVPLGVLKLPADSPHAIKFSPALPAVKLKAIKRLQMGVLDRTVLFFPDSFKAKSPWNEYQLLYRIPPIAEKGQWIEGLNLGRFVNKPVLSMFNAGDVALKFEQQTNDQLIASSMHYLKSVYGKKIPQPVNIIASRWGNDPYSMGSYSHIPPGADGSDYTILGDPVKRLRFAGEATLRSYPASVRGAYLSGVREADRIIKEGASG